MKVVILIIISDVSDIIVDNNINYRNINYAKKHVGNVIEIETECIVVVKVGSILSCEQCTERRMHFFDNFS